MAWLRPRRQAIAVLGESSTTRWGPVPAGRRRRRPVDRGVRDSAGRRLRWEVAALLVGVGVWEAVGKGYPLLLASPDQVWSAGVRLAQTGTLWHEFAVTLETLFIGFAVAMAVGVPLGLAMGLSRAVARIAGMYVYWMLSTPEIALIPLIIVILGYGPVARFVVILIFALPVIAARTMEGVVSVPAVLHDMARSFQASGWHRLTRVIVPGALPSLMVATRLGFARSLLGVVSAGILMEAFGLGGQVYFYQQNFDLAAMLLYLVAVILVGLAGTSAIQWVDRRVTRWNTGATAA